MEFGNFVDYLREKSRLNFGSDPEHIPDTSRS